MKHRFSAEDASLERLELMDKVSIMRRDVDQKRYKRQRMITDIKQKRAESFDMRKKRDEMNAQVKELVIKGKEHLMKRDEVQAEVKALKEKRSKIMEDIGPKADSIRSTKQVRYALNRRAGSSVEELEKDFQASLKTLFTMDLSLKEEVIMVEMVMDVQRRFNARKNAESLNKDIKEERQGIREIEDDASQVTFKIMSLAADGQVEHLAAMELFDRKNEISAQGQECHERFVALQKEIRTMSREIDVLTKQLDVEFKKIKPMESQLDGVRLRRREEQRLAKLREAKTKMESTGRIGIEDLQVLMTSGALKIGESSGGSEEEKKREREAELERKQKENEERNRRLQQERIRKKEEFEKRRKERLERRKKEEEEQRQAELDEKRQKGRL